MKLHLSILFLCTIIVHGVAGALAGAQTQKDYLSSVEADKIRDAETTNDRIKLFLSFADDRLKKLPVRARPSVRKPPRGHAQLRS